MSIIQTSLSNIDDWVKLSCKLFPEDTYEELYELYYRYLTDANIHKEIGFLYQVDDKFVAFINFSIRHEYVNGTDTSPVLFIEAIYVLEEYRKQGIASKLIRHAEDYAKEKGIKQIASYCLIDNTNSELFHKSCGFKETERVIFFSIFKNSKINKIVRVGNDKGKVITVQFELEGMEFVALNGGPQHKLTEAISFIVNCVSQEEIDYYWKKLSEGGDEKAQVCGWLKDKFGVSWQIIPYNLSDMLSDSNFEKAERVMNALLQMKKIDMNKLMQAYEI